MKAYDPALGWDESGYLLLGFSPSQPRTLSGAVFNVGGGFPTERDHQAHNHLLRAGRIVQAPGCVWGWWVLAGEAP